MMLTEDEAKTKWCPEVRFADTASNGIISNRDMGVRHEYCIASQCMAWCWDDRADVVYGADIRRVGYCGKAPVKYQRRW